MIFFKSLKINEIKLFRYFSPILLNFDPKSKLNCGYMKGKIVMYFRDCVTVQLVALSQGTSM